MKNIIFLFGFIICVCLNAFSQKYFEIEPTFNCSCGTFTKKLSELKKYSESEVQIIFDAISNKSGMEFGYPQGGCQQRAEMMHMILSDMKIEHAKIWIFAPCNLDINDKTQLEITDKNGLAKDNIIKWSYHVAPVILLQKNNKSDTIVIDPALNKEKPLKVSEWTNSMRNIEKAKYTFLDSKYYFFNTQNGGSSPVLNGFFYSYEAVPNQVTMYDNATVERELAVNDVAIFLKKKLDSGYNDTNNSIKTLLGNVENMISFFASQQRRNQLQGVSMRDLLTNHSQLIIEAQNYYNERVDFWIKKKK